MLHLYVTAGLEYVGEIQKLFSFLNSKYETVSIPQGLDAITWCLQGNEEHSTKFNYFLSFTFLAQAAIYVEIIKIHSFNFWTAEEREHSLIKRLPPLYPSPVVSRRHILVASTSLALGKWCFVPKSLVPWFQVPIPSLLLVLQFVRHRTHLGKYH